MSGRMDRGITAFDQDWMDTHSKVVVVIVVDGRVVDSTKLTTMLTTKVGQ